MFEQRISSSAHTFLWPICMWRQQTLNLVLQVVNDCVLLTLKPQIPTEIVGSTLSQATKAVREGRGIALHYFRPLHLRGEGSASRPGRKSTPEKTRTNCTGRWVDWGPVWKSAGKSRHTGIRSPDRPARRQSLFRLSLPAHKSLQKRT